MFTARLMVILTPVYLFVWSVRADLIWEQQSGKTNHLKTIILHLHGDKLRIDQPDESMAVIVDLNTHDSFTLITTNKTFLQRTGAEVRAAMAKNIGAETNGMNLPPAPAVDTGNSEIVDGHAAEIFNWSGAAGLTEKLWVVRDFPQFEGIKTELAKLDRFNETGPHRNAQPLLSQLPGMVVKSEAVSRGRIILTRMNSIKIEPQAARLFELPADYTPWSPPAKKP